MNEARAESERDRARGQGGLNGAWHCENSRKTSGLRATAKQGRRESPPQFRASPPRPGASSPAGTTVYRVTACRTARDWARGGTKPSIASAEILSGVATCGVNPDDASTTMRAMSAPASSYDRP